MFQKIASNTLYQVLSKFSTAFISIFLLSILTKYLPLEVFGMYNKVYNYLGIFAFLADLGLYTIAIREITENKNNTKSIISNIVSLRILLGIIIFFIALLLAVFLPWYNSFIWLSGIAIIGVFTLVSLINSSVLALMQAYMKMEFSFVSVVLGKILNIGLVSYIVFILFPEGGGIDYGVSLLYIFAAGLLGIILTTVMNYVYASRYVHPIGLGFDREYMTHIFRISLPYGIALFLWVVYFKVDVVLLSLLEPQAAADISIALYSLPMKIVEVLMVLWGFYLNSLLPSLSSAYTSKNTQTLQKLIDISLKVLVLGGMCIFVFGTLLRDHVIRIIANDEYLSSSVHLYSSSDVFGVVLWVLFLHFISLVFIYMLIAAKRQWELLKINLFVTIFNILGNIILIPQYSFLWAAIVTVLSQLLLMTLGYVTVKKYYKIPIDTMYYLKLLSVSLAVFLSIWYLLRYFSLGLYLDVIVYGVLGGLWFLGAMYFWLLRKTL